MQITALRSQELHVHKNYLLASAAGVALLAASATGAAPLTLGVNAQHTWDSNFTRTPEPAAEQFTEATAHIQLDPALSRQALSLRAQGGRVEYAERHFMDADIYQLAADWRGAFAQRLETQVHWSRSRRPGDPDDSIGRGLIRETRLEGRFAYGGAYGLQPNVHGSHHQVEQSHRLRQHLDFQDQSVGAGLDYRSGRDSTIRLSYSIGERDYMRADMAPGPAEDLNYGYRQLLLELAWLLSPRTTLTGALGHYEWNGTLQDDSGVTARMALAWLAAETVELRLGYSREHPAAGDPFTQATREHRYHLEAQWRWRERLSVQAEALRAEQRFGAASFGFRADEVLQRFTPLALSYRSGDNIELNAAARWSTRRSPLEARGHEAREVLLALQFAL